jgi:hypothetical protein
LKPNILWFYENAPECPALWASNFTRSKLPDYDLPIKGIYVSTGFRFLVYLESMTFSEIKKQRLKLDDAYQFPILAS